MRRVILMLCFVFIGQVPFAQTLEEIALAKIDTVILLIAEVETLGTDAVKEKMTVRTAGVFLEFANWDEANIAKNEYGAALEPLTEGAGRIIRVNSVEDMAKQAIGVAEEKKQMPGVNITETNQGGHKGCTWKCVKNEAGNNVLSIINMGKSSAKLNIELKGAKVGTACRDILNGIMVSSKPSLKPYEVYFVEVLDAMDGIAEPVSSDSYLKLSKPFEMYPNPTSGVTIVDLNQEKLSGELRVYKASEGW